MALPLSRTVIVTGGTGFVGGALLERLIRAGWQVIGVTRDPVRAAALYPRIRWIEWSRIGEHQCRAADAVLHLSTSYGHATPAVLVEEANVVLPLRLFATAASAGVKLFVNTDSYFSRAPKGYPYIPSYRESKRAFSDAARNLLAGTMGARFVDVELEHPYGPLEPPTKFCGQVLDAFLDGVESFPTTLGEQKRDFVHVDDVAAAYETLLMHVDELKDYQRIGLGTGFSTSVRQFIEQVAELTAAATQPKFGALAYRPHEIMNSVAQISFLRDLGWQPSFTLREGLADSLVRRARYRSLDIPTSLRGFAS